MLTLEPCAALFPLVASATPSSNSQSNACTSNASVSWSAELASCADLRALHARALHADVVLRDHDQPPFWNALARAYASSGAPRLALHVCLQMHRRDEYTFPLAFKLCSQLSAFDEAVCLHAQLVKLGLCTNTHSLNALVALYSKFGHLVSAQQLFDEIAERTVSSWATMIAGYDRNERHAEALFTFAAMMEDWIWPDEAALVSTLAACTHGGFLEFGKVIHAYSVAYGLGLGSVGFATALLDFYAKCGELDYARKVFDRMVHKNVLSWSAMIGGLALHGLGREAIELFDEMVATGVRPTSVTMTNVLSACSHIGMVDEGMRLFELMREEYGVEPRIEHYGCVVDLLGRAGSLDDARRFIETMPMRPTAAIWRSVLGAACTHGDLEAGKVAGERLAETGETVAGDYVMMANLYAQFGLWEEVGKVRTEMNDMGVRKVAGYSSVEVNGEAHRFVMGDASHPLAEHVHEMLRLLSFDLQDKD